MCTGSSRYVYVACREHVCAQVRHAVLTLHEGSMGVYRVIMIVFTLHIHRVVVPRDNIFWAV